MIEYYIDNGIGVIVLNRPERLNAFNYNMIKSIAKIIDKFINSTEVKVIFIEGNGRAFCSGGDIKEMLHMNVEKDQNVIAEFFGLSYGLVNKIHSLTKPYIAFMDGIAMGGGFGLSVNGGYKIVTENTIVAMPENYIGFFPDVGASYFCKNFLYNFGLYMCVTGIKANAATCLNTKIATHYLESNKKKELLDCLREYCKHSKYSLAYLLSQLCKDCDLEDKYQVNYTDIQDCFNIPCIDIIMTKLQNLNNQWSQKTIKTIMNLSPYSIKLFLYLYNYSGSSLTECLLSEYFCAQNIITNPDVNIGISSFLQKKKPIWHINNISDINNEDFHNLLLPKLVEKFYFN